ncbi:CPBP family intramembrane glutamic endopeptidase [Pseudopedobacter beijingensis]|uniref:CPBP family intramembrane glutamic endopeptidase n=1 Tax=Pseudopedobacter beijingensis TaxID=1207056 RepID=A0ABW4I8W6_9SPHI
MDDHQLVQYRHPIYELLYLILFCVLSGFAFSFLGMFVFMGMNSFSTDLLLDQQALSINVGFLRILQIFSSTGIFIMGPYLFSKKRGYHFERYYKLDGEVFPNLAVLSILCMFCALPLIEWMSAVNAKMVFPESLKGLESWMKMKEQEAELLTKQLLVMPSFADFTINFLMIALLPAIGEELLFRGALQNIFSSWFKNHHVAIWVTAILFSAIHLQFFGFFPRMFLGALFGYLLVWGKSLWYPIIGHLVNNGAAVVAAFILQQQGKSIDELDKTDTFPVYAYGLSAIFTLVLLLRFYQKSRKQD